MRSVNNDNRCFACGKNNPIGLKLDFKTDSELTISQLIIDENYAGWEGIVHGGILSTMLDEVMVKSANSKGFVCVTGELNVRYKKPCLTGKEYELRGKVTEIKKRLIFTEGEIIDMNGEVIATGKGKLFVVDLKKNSII